MKDEEIDDLLMKAAQAPDDLKPEMLQRIADSIKPSIRPVGPLPSNWLMTGELVLVSAAVSLSGAARAGFFGYQKMDILQRSLIFSVLAFLAWLVGSQFVSEMIPGSLRRYSSGTLLGLGSLTLLAIFSLLFRDYHIDHFVSIGIVCLFTGFLHAIPAVFLSWLLLRRGFALNPVAGGFAAGTLGGLAGVVMLELHCPNFQAAHILVWHTAVVPLSGAAGALVAWMLRFLIGFSARLRANSERDRD